MLSRVSDYFDEILSSRAGKPLGGIFHIVPVSVRSTFRVGVRSGGSSPVVPSFAFRRRFFPPIVSLCFLLFLSLPIFQSLLHRSCHKFTQRRCCTNDLEKVAPPL
jgi:hypothetical protein